MRNLSITWLIFTSCTVSQFFLPLSKLPPTWAHPHNSVCAVFKPPALPAFSLSEFPPSSSSYSMQLHVQASSKNHISSHCKASSEAKLSLPSTPVHTPITCSLTSIFPFSPSVPFTVLEIPCKINAPPELSPFDKGQKAAHEITPILAALAETN